MIFEIIELQYKLYDSKNRYIFKVEMGYEIKL